MRRSLPRTAGRAAVLFAAVASAGCATKGDLRDVQTELRDLAARQEAVLDALERQTRITQDTLGRQSDQLFEFRGSIANDLRRILDELSTMRELTAQNQRTIASIRDQLTSLRVGAGAGGGAGGGEAGGPPPGATESADALYNAAVGALNRGSLEGARLGFENFLEAYPNDELAPLALYNLADVHVQRGEDREALRLFLEVPRRFPGDAKVPDALYRVGSLHVELGDEAEGRRVLERLVNTWPDSAIAELARRKLDEIR